jgi:YidC/Oxa1 family membrane protein insertase
VLAKPLFWLLDQLHKVIQNWGWSIVALVVLLKIAFYWLNASAYRSMAKMKALGPRMTDLRERYKEKPQKMQQEMMRIYREEKVNPLGGCLPILCRCRSSSRCTGCCCRRWRCAMRRGSAGSSTCPHKDPWFILPLLMTASSLLQVWLNPTPADPMQAKLMWIMPLIFGVHVLLLPGRPGAVLADEQHPVHRPAVVHQQAARGQVARAACQRARCVTRPGADAPFGGLSRHDLPRH